jgi:hypothetical protein
MPARAYFFQIRSSPPGEGEMSEEELTAEIEEQRTLNAARRGGFSF